MLYLWVGVLFTCSSSIPSGSKDPVDPMPAVALHLLHPLLCVHWPGQRPVASLQGVCQRFRPGQRHPPWHQIIVWLSWLSGDFPPGWISCILPPPSPSALKDHQNLKLGTTTASETSACHLQAKESTLPNPSSLSQPQLLPVNFHHHQIMVPPEVLFRSNLHSCLDLCVHRDALDPCSSVS